MGRKYRIEYLVTGCAITKAQEQIKKYLDKKELTSEEDGKKIIDKNGDIIKHDMQLINDHLHIKFTLYCQDDDIEVYENIHNIVNDLVSNIQNSKNNINLLYDEVSAELAAISYPVIHRFENKLRSFVAKLLLKTLGPDWHTKEKMAVYFPEKECETIVKNNGNILYEANFLAPLSILTKKIRLKNSGSLEDLLNNYLISKDDIQPYINKSYIDRYFIEKYIKKVEGDSDSKWIEDFESDAHILNNYRIKIAHNKKILFKDYNEVIKEKIILWDKFIDISIDILDALCSQDIPLFKKIKNETLTSEQLKKHKKDEGKNFSLFRLSQHYGQIGENVKSENYLRKSLPKVRKEDKFTFSCKLMLAEILYKDEEKKSYEDRDDSRYEEAKGYCNQIIQSNSKVRSKKDYLKAYYLLGEIHSYFGEYDVAIEAHENAADSHLEQPYLSLARLYEKKQYDEKKQYAEMQEASDDSITTEKKENLQEKIKNKHFKELNKYKEKSLEYYIKAAESGVAEAQFKIGKLLDDGYKAKTRNEDSLYYYDLSAKQGYLPGILKTAERIKEKNPNRCKKLLSCACKSRSYEACLKLGSYYADDFFELDEDITIIIPELEKYKRKSEFKRAKKVFNRAETYFKDAIRYSKSEREKNDAKYKIADLYSIAGYFEDAMEMNEKLANPRGYKKSQYELGRMYHEGEGVEQDLDKAIQWYTKSEDNELKVRLAEVYGLKAQQLLANYKERGIKKDKEDAIKCFKKALSNDNDSAIKQLKAGQLKELLNQGEAIT